MGHYLTAGDVRKRFVEPLAELSGRFRRTLPTMGRCRPDETDRPARSAAQRRPSRSGDRPACANSSARPPASWKMPLPAFIATGTWRPNGQAAASWKNGPRRPRLVHRNRVVLADIRPRIAHRLPDHLDDHGPLGHVEFRLRRPAGGPLDQHDPAGRASGLDRGQRPACSRRQDSRPYRRTGVDVATSWPASSGHPPPRAATRSPYHSFGHLRHGIQLFSPGSGWKGPIARRGDNMLSPRRPHDHGKLHGTAIGLSASRSRPSGHEQGCGAGRGLPRIGSAPSRSGSTGALRRRPAGPTARGRRPWTSDPPRAAGEAGQLHQCAALRAALPGWSARAAGGARRPGGRAL